MGPRNIRALDGIRGIAIILVMLHHFQIVLPGGDVMRYVKGVFEYGWSGVDLFFVLSGFLITGILIDTRGAVNYFRAFYVRRVLRIFPLYYAVLILILGIVAFIVPRPDIVPIPADQKLYFLYLTNWLVLWKGTWGPNMLGHFWSLAVEEQFYLIWAACVWLLAPPRLAKVAAGASLVALLSRMYWVGQTGPSQAIVMATVTRMDSLLCGALAAICFRDTGTLAALRGKLPYIAVAALIVFAGGVVAPFNYGDWGPLFFVETFGFTLLALGFACFVLYAAVTNGSGTLLQSALGNRVLTAFGKYSYGIYVYHVPLSMICGSYIVFRYLPPAVIMNPYFRVSYFAFLIGSSFLIAKLSYEYFEKYFLNLKRFFEPEMSKASPAAVGVQGAADCLNGQGTSK